MRILARWLALLALANLALQPALAASDKPLVIVAGQTKQLPAGDTLIVADGIDVGATDTTITRTGAGSIAVEGNAVYRTGGTDVAVADGGTGGGAASGTLLDNITGFGSTGQIVRSGAGTFVFRSLTAPAAGITVANGDGVSGNPTLALANDLAGLEGLGSNGLAARTGTDTWTVRTLTGTSAEITVTNGDGVSGNPTLSLPSSLTFTGKTITGGAYASVSSIGVTGSITGSAFIRVTASTGGIGYGTGAGGTVSQGSGSGKATGVAINRATGTITMNNAALAGAATVTFTMTNNAIEANDQLVVNHQATGTFGAYLVTARVTGSTTADVTVTNVSGGSLSEAIVIKYSLIKSAVS